MKQSKALLKKQDPLANPNKSTTQQELKAFKYQNYLVHKNAQVKSELQFIKEIVDKQNLPTHDKFKEAKALAEKIMDKPGNSNQQIIKSINAKLEILKKMY